MLASMLLWCDARTRPKDDMENGRMGKSLETRTWSSR
jgi:hypothetical protein